MDSRMQQLRVVGWPWRGRRRPASQALYSVSNRLFSGDVVRFPVPCSFWVEGSQVRGYLLVKGSHAPEFGVLEHVVSFALRNRVSLRNVAADNVVFVGTLWIEKIPSLVAICSSHNTEYALVSPRICDNAENTEGKLLRKIILDAVPNRIHENDGF
ncbi:hypothetical protein B0H10DRAFT_2194216, partial [Mycena sp. CBHHK59/15]